MASRQCVFAQSDVKARSRHSYSTSADTKKKWLASASAIVGRGALLFSSTFPEHAFRVAKAQLYAKIPEGDNKLASSLVSSGIPAEIPFNSREKP